HVQPAGRDVGRHHHLELAPAEPSIARVRCDGVRLLCSSATENPSFVSTRANFFALCFVRVNTSTDGISVSPSRCRNSAG
ncbi:MAG: hypothetical protein J0I06_13305, partial [Planctomycetes bacterium]|nr:hypothetical protein [Planctomycetota bacterium]